MRLAPATTWKEGLVRGLKFLEDSCLSISLLVTDRHKQIDKWLKSNEPGITHKYYVGHDALGQHFYEFFLLVPPTTYF